MYMWITFALIVGMCLVVAAMAVCIRKLRKEVREVRARIDSPRFLADLITRGTVSQQPSDRTDGPNRKGPRRRLRILPVLVFGAAFEATRRLREHPALVASAAVTVAVGIVALVMFWPEQVSREPEDPPPAAGDAAPAAVVPSQPPHRRNQQQPPTTKAQPSHKPAAMLDQQRTRRRRSMVTRSDEREDMPPPDTTESKPPTATPSPEPTKPHETPAPLADLQVEVDVLSEHAQIGVTL